MDKNRGKRAIGAGSLVLSIAYMLGAVELSYGSLHRPGPGLWPTVVGVLLAAVSIGAIVESFVVSTDDDDDVVVLPVGHDRLRVLGFSVVLIAWILALPYTGYLLTTIIVASLMLWILGAMKPVRAGAYGALFTIPTYYFFAEILNTRFPEPSPVSVLIRWVGLA